MAIDIVTIIAIAGTALISLVDLVVNCLVCCKDRSFRSSCCEGRGASFSTQNNSSRNESSDEDLEI